MPSLKSKKQHIAHTLLARAHSPSEAQTLFTEKVLHRPLPLTPTTHPTNARSTRQKAHLLKKKLARKNPGKPRPLSAKQKRALQIYTIPKSERKYAIYVPLWRMWCGYIREILGIDGSRGGGEYGRFVEARSAGAVLAAADFHGALVCVVRCRCVSRVGVRGIVVRDTKRTFEIVTERDEVKVVPKEHTVLRFEVPIVDETLDEKRGVEHGGEHQEKVSEEPPKPLVFELYGHSFDQRASERVSKKFVLHLPPDL